MDGPEAFLEHVNVSRETIEKLETYANLLSRWQSKINLISTNSLQQAWHRHFLDSAQIYLMSPKKAASAIDVGTGAGFPGLVLSIMGMKNVQLVEQSVPKLQPPRRGPHRLRHSPPAAICRGPVSVPH